MLAMERRRKIIEALSRSGDVRASELRARLGVSNATVRRDLDLLEREGVLRRVHGGAKHTEQVEYHSSTEKATTQRAAELIEPGMAVAVAAGTPLDLARHLASVEDLTVVTNCLSLAASLTQGEGPAPVLVLIGGICSAGGALVGPLAEKTLKDLHVDVLFTGAHGFGTRGGFTAADLLEAAINRAFVACASRVIVITESRRWQAFGLASWAELSEVDVLVIDSAVAAEAITALETAAVDVIRVEVDDSDQQLLATTACPAVATFRAAEDR